MKNLQPRMTKKLMNSFCWSHDLLRTNNNKITEFISEDHFRTKWSYCKFLLPDNQSFKQRRHKNIHQMSHIAQSKQYVTIGGLEMS